MEVYAVSQHRVCWGQRTGCLSGEKEHPGMQSVHLTHLQMDPLPSIRQEAGWEAVGLVLTI